MALGTSNLVNTGTSGSISSLLPNNKPLQIGTSTGMGNQTTTSPIQPHNQPGVLATSLGSDVSQIGGAIGSVLSPLTNATSSLYGALTPQQPAQAPVAPFSISSSPSTSNSSGVPSGGLPLAPGVTPITNVAQATAAGAAANPNNQTTGNTNTSGNTPNQTNTSGTPGAVSSVFPGIVSGLAGIQPAPGVAAAGTSLLNTATGQQTGNAAYNQNNILGGAQTSANIAQNQTPGVINAENQYNQFAQSSPYMTAAQYNPNVAADIASGRSALLGQTFAQELAAKQAAVTNALQGQGQQITAAGQQGNLGVSGQQNQNTAAQNAGALANTAQANQIQAQTAAGTLTQPSPAGYGQTVFNPQTGTYSNGGGGAQPGDPMYSALQNYAQGLQNNTIPYSSIPSSITSNPILNNQLLQMAGQNTGGTSGTGFNLNQSLGTSGAQQSGQANITLMNSANTAAQGIQQTIQQFLAQNPAINSSPLTLANSAQQWLEGKQLGDPTYQTLFNDLNEYTNTLAPILGVGGDPTNLKTEIAQGFINSAASGQSISQVLDSIGALATQKIQNLQSGLSGGGVVSGTGTSPNTQFPGFSQ